MGKVGVETIVKCTNSSELKVNSRMDRCKRDTIMSAQQKDMAVFESADEPRIESRLGASLARDERATMLPSVVSIAINQLHVLNQSPHAVLCRIECSRIYAHSDTRGREVRLMYG